MTDWAAIRAAYEAGEGARSLARKHGIKSPNSIRDKAKRESWVGKKSGQGGQTGGQASGQTPPAKPSEASKPIIGELIAPENRDAAGRFLAGAPSGNPGGRPKALVEVVQLARSQTKAAVERLMAIAENIQNPAAARVHALEVVLDRGWGKAPAFLAVDLDGDGGGGSQESGNRGAALEQFGALVEGIIAARKHDVARAEAQEATPVPAQ